MRLSKRSEYGLMAAVRLAQQQRESGGYLRSRQIAEEEGLPAKFLESVLLSLKSAGILESKVGSGGGYRLASKPEDIAIGEIVKTLEPDSSDVMDSGTTDGPQTAARRSLITVNSRMTRAFLESMRPLTIAALLDADASDEFGVEHQSLSFDGGDAAASREAAL